MTQESLKTTSQGLFSEINLGYEQLSRTHADKKKKPCVIIKEIAKDLKEFANGSEHSWDLVGQFEQEGRQFYKHQLVSDILSAIVIDSKKLRREHEL